MEILLKEENGTALRQLIDQDTNPVFTEELFPINFPMVERKKCWTSLFSAFDENDVKALERILQQKQRFHIEMQDYLWFQQKLEDDENTKELLLSCKNLGPSFMDAANAESKLREMKSVKEW